MQYLSQFNKKTPLVTVIMPAHNAERFIAPAIDSIISQTYPNIELIIVDDHSTDSTRAIIEKYHKKYSVKHYTNLKRKPVRVFYIKVFETKSKMNAAGNGAMNQGLLHAKGEYIARMDADDMSYPTRIEKQVAFMEQHPRTIVCGSQAKVVDGKGKITGIKRMPVEHDDIYRMYGILHPLIHPTVMFKRRLLPNKNKIYELRWDVNDDYYTFFKLLNYGRFANIDEYLLKYRIHGNNLSYQNPKKKFMNSVKIRLEAVTNLNYRMSTWTMLIMAAQMALVSIIPESLIVPLYMAVRGMSSPTETLKKIYKQITTSFRGMHFDLPKHLSISH